MKRLRKRKSVLPSVMLWGIIVWCYYMAVFLVPLKNYIDIRWMQ